MSKLVIRRLRTMILALTLAGSTVLGVSAIGCDGSAMKDVSAEAARRPASDLADWQSNYGTSW
ncbi:MAG: hypothetical protein AMXMBFR13_41230 [Phycisphaerae bacterium]